MISKIIKFAIERPRIVMALTALLVVAALIQIPRINVDTDPENMLTSDNPVRKFHNEIKKEFALYDFIVLGVVNDVNLDGAFNVGTLSKVYEITQKIQEIPGVISSEVIAPSTKDNIEQAGIGTVRFNWLMERPPKTRKEAVAVRTQAQDHPIFRDSVVSENGRALALYIPIKKKDISYEVAQEIQEILKNYGGEEQFYITGLPVAEDQFGVEMFKQMAISAPLAGLVIFLLMLFFFKSIQLIIAPMLLAMATVLITMGLLIGFGLPVHIMSSMIPIFLMPIAVLDSVHILSEFFDKYRTFNDRKKTVLFVLDELFSPMLFTSLTSAAGFFSLSFSPIPPVQVFGIFVATGVMVAWALTMVFIPAYIMLIKERGLKNIGYIETASHDTVIDKLLQLFRGIAVNRFKTVLVVTVVLVGLSLYGITRIQVNDNPIRWFESNHPIRIADRVLNRHFAGTYEAYYVLEARDKDAELFIDPVMLTYMESLQENLAESGLVGKTTSLVDLVKKIYYELLGGDKANSVIPRTRQAVAQTLISFENSHKPDDLWHFTTPDYSKAIIWLQLRSGDNKDMEKVVRWVADFVKKNPPPYDVDMKWAGNSYLNIVWQNNMVGGMLKNFMGSFVIVLFMMLFLFKSPIKALISMIPLSVTILFIYSLLGFFGKDYDMPVAVLSALTLGLSIDFAIHFIQRAIEIYQVKKSWQETSVEMFAGPGRAIIRNALVVAIGFLPLLAAPLVPYKTVGFFMFTIMAVSSVATLFIIPAIITAIPKRVFAIMDKGVGCHCGNCMLIGSFAAVAVAYVLYGYTMVNWSTMTFVTIGVIIISSGLCFFSSKRKICIK